MGLCLEQKGTSGCHTWQMLTATAPSPLPRSELSIQKQLLYRKVQYHRGGLVSKAHRHLYHSTLGLRVIRNPTCPPRSARPEPSPLGGIRPFRQKSTCLPQLTSGACVVQMWSRNPPQNFRQQSSRTPTCEKDCSLQSFWHIGTHKARAAGRDFLISGGDLLIGRPPRAHLPTSCHQQSKQDQILFF